MQKAMLRRWRGCTRWYNGDGDEVDDTQGVRPDEGEGRENDDVDSAGGDNGVNGEEDDDDAQGVRLDEGGRVEGCVQRVPRGGRVQGDTSSLGSTVTGERSFFGAKSPKFHCSGVP